MASAVNQALAPIEPAFDERAIHALAQFRFVVQFFAARKIIGQAAAPTDVCGIHILVRLIVSLREVVGVAQIIFETRVVFFDRVPDVFFEPMFREIIRPCIAVGINAES